MVRKYAFQNALYLHQLFGQAESKNMTLSVDVNSLDDAYVFSVLSLISTLFRLLMAAMEKLSIDKAVSPRKVPRTEEDSISSSASC